MKKNTKIWLFTAIALILIGFIIFGGVMTMLNWNFKNLSTTKYETNEHEIKEEINDISIAIDTADIALVPYLGEGVKVICFEEKKHPHTVTVENGALTIRNSEKKWYEGIGINFMHSKISIYLPVGEYGTLTVTASTGDISIPEDFSFTGIEISASTGDVKNESSASGNININVSTGDVEMSGISAESIDIKTTTGDIELEGIECAESMNLHVSTGKTELDGIRCKSFFSHGSTGDIALKSVVATDSITVERNTGGVELEGADADEIYIKTTTGNVYGTLLSDKIFFAESDTGRVSVPKTESGGKCTIRTDTGKIFIDIK